MKRRAAFTMIELIFVIVVMGILSKYGVEFLAQAYRNYVYQHVNNKLQNSSSIAVEYIANKLKYRVKDSVIVRDPSNANWSTNFKALEGENNLPGYDVLEWIAYDIEGFRGGSDTVAFWSGILDKEYAHAIPIPTDLYSPGTNTTNINDYIDSLSNGSTSVDDAAIYIMSSDSDIYTDYGWDGNAINDQQRAMHPIKRDSGDVSKFLSSNAQNMAIVNANIDDARYKLAWTAYAVVYEPGNNFDGNLILYYDYQPWNGEKYTDGKSALIMQHVSAFRKRQSFGVMKIQVCTKSEYVKQVDTDEEQYAVCQEKTIY
jgi:prepilin-type N-terminal cleavage/methylation domain-containing protein